MAVRHMSEVMHHRRPITLRGSASVQLACQTMRDHAVGAVMVTDADGALEGIFTGRDAVRLLADGRNAAHTRLDVVMTRNPATMSPGQGALDALHLMHDGGFRHVPVTENGRVVGIVSHGDFRAIEHATLDEQTGLWERL
jgi:CBS domain-containing protein